MIFFLLPKKHEPPSCLLRLSLYSYRYIKQGLTVVALPNDKEESEKKYSSAEKNEVERPEATAGLVKHAGAVQATGGSTDELLLAGPRRVLMMMMVPAHLHRLLVVVERGLLVASFTAPVRVGVRHRQDEQLVAPVMLR